MSLLKTIQLSLFLTGVAVLGLQSQASQAQDYGQPSCQSETYRPPVYRPPTYQPPVYRPPTYQPPTYQPPRFNPNPVVLETGTHLGGITYDPFSGNVRIQTQQSKLRQSYFDPNRQNADPGSYRTVDRYETIGGVRYHVTGHEWTTNGKPHGNLNRQSVQQVAPGLIREKNEAVGYGVGSASRGGTIGPSQTPPVQQTHQHNAPHQPQSTPRYNPF